MPDVNRRRQSSDSKSSEWEERSWPVYGSLALLVGYFAAVSLALFDWDHPQWFFNAKFYLTLAPLMLLLGLALVKFSEQRAIRRGIQLSIILSLIMHLSLFVGMVALDLVSVPQGDDAVASRRKAQRDPVILPDYHPSQWDATSETQQDFEKPVETSEAKPEQKQVERRTIEPERTSLEKTPTVDPAMQREATPNTPTKVARQERTPAETLQQLPSKLSRNSAEMENRERPPEQIEVKRQADPLSPQSTAAKAELMRKRNAPSQSRQTTQVEAAASAAASLSRRETERQPQLAASSAALQRQSAEPALAAVSPAAPAQRRADPQLTPASPATSAARRNAAEAASSMQTAPTVAATARPNDAMSKAQVAASSSKISPAPSAKLAKADGARASPQASLFTEPIDYAAQAASRNPSQLSSAATELGRGDLGSGSGVDGAVGEMLGGVELGVVRIASQAAMRRAANDGNPALDETLSGGGRESGISGRTGSRRSPSAAASLDGIAAGSDQPNRSDGQTDGSQLASGETGGKTELTRQAAMGVTSRAGDGAATAASMSNRSLGSRGDRAEAATGDAIASAVEIGGARLGRSQGPTSGPTAVMVAGDATEIGGASRGEGVADGNSGGSPGAASPSLAKQGAEHASSVKVNADEGAGGLGDRMAPAVGAIARRRADEAPQLAINMTRFPVRASRSGLPKISSAIAMPTEAFRRRMMREEKTGEGADGPSPEVREAIERGLAFLARHQMPNGSWSLKNFPLTQPDHAAEYRDERSRMDSDTAATGLALLAYLGAGYHHLDDKYQNEVRKGLAFLIENQQGNGDLYVRMDDYSNSNAWLYSHGIASIALCEAYGMTQDAKLREAAQKALDFIASSQDRSVGAWRYLPGIGGDTSVSGWMTMALKSGQLAGLDTSQQTFDGIDRWLARAAYQPEGGVLFVYNPDALDNAVQRHGRFPSKTMTAVGLLMRLYMGSNRDTTVMRKGAEHLLANLPEVGSRDQPQRDTYYWYYATQVMFHMKGEYWQAWNNRLEPLLVESQLVEGPLAGSWEPEGEIPDRWGEYAGRIYVTTMNLLSLEVHHRHLPLYVDAAK